MILRLFSTDVRIAPSTRHSRRSRRGGLALLFLASSLAAGAQTPQWIWHPNQGREPGDNEVRYFRKTFDVTREFTKATLVLSADNHLIAHLNGKKVAAADEWSQATRVDVTKGLVRGSNLLAVEAANDSGPAGLVVRLEITLKDDSRQVLVSDKSWRTSHLKREGWEQPGFVANDGWVAAKGLGELGVSPWGNVFAAGGSSGQSGGASRQATAAESITTPPGFHIELLHSAVGEEGSWICLTIDDRGRLIISPQNARQSMLRMTLGPEGKIAKQESIGLGIGEAMGLLHAFDSLYANAKGPEGTGLYRLQDTDGDDQYDKAKFLHPMRGGGEHGPHGLRLGPDNMIYVMNGNHTRIPDEVAPSSPHQDYAEDQLLPRDWDGNGHARGILAPGGYIARTDPEGKTWELLLAGFRNSYDFDFNADGEMFTYDSDMEWDWGMPWYRPTVVYHCVSGADFGWRSGTGKWPWYYPDALPPVEIIGIGSPTGVVFGEGARFPALYQRALYVMDWTYGRIVAVHLTPEGAGYSSRKETFVAGRPLNVTDMEIGRDGAFYFTTGGRGTQSGLYRVTYRGSESTERVDTANARGREARALRRKLEAFHGRRDPGAVAAAWPHLDSHDRFIRHAARVAVESQPLDQWQYRALTEARPRAALTALLALARKGPAAAQDDLLEALERQLYKGLDDAQKIEALRVAGLSFIRMGPPSPGTARQVIDVVLPLYPSKNETLNLELCRMLVYLEAPGVVEKTLDLLDQALTQEEQFHYVVALRTLKSGWTLDQRRRYFSWFNRDLQGGAHPPELLQWFADVDRGYNNGASYNKFVQNFKNTALETLSEEEKKQLAPILEGKEMVPVQLVTTPPAFVKEWTEADLLPILDQAGRGRDFKQGRVAFHAAQCVACHKFGNEGGATGQELTAVASRYTLRDIVDSILHPSKVVSEQYQSTTFYLKNGDDVTGRVLDEREGKLVVLTDPINNGTVEVAKDAIRQQAPSQLSAMPEGLINVLTREQILDLLAYLQSGGNPGHQAFR